MFKEGSEKIKKWIKNIFKLQFLGFTRNYNYNYNTEIVICSFYFVILGCLLLTQTPSAPSEEFVKELLLSVKFFGFIAAIVIPLMQINNRSLWLGFLRGFLIYLISLKAIERYGDTIYRQTVISSNNTGVFIVTAIIIGISVFLNKDSYPYKEKNCSLSDMTSKEMSMLPVATTRDVQYATAHEAGHALICAALYQLPGSLSVLTINNYPDFEGSLGKVIWYNKNLICEKTFAEWQMIFCLAGQKGEVLLFEKPTLGGTKDYTEWLRIAQMYLSNHFQGLFYTNPQNIFEHTQNNEKLEALKTNQLAMLKVFFDMNMDVLKKLYSIALEKRTMTYDELVPFFKKVQFPEGFPLLCDTKTLPSTEQNK